MSKRGFTIIELLAVLIIISIISIITVQTVTNVITDSEISKASSSATGYINSIEYNIAILLNDDNISNDILNYPNNSYTDTSIEVNGQKPSKVELTVVNGNVSSGKIWFSDYEISISNGNVDTVTLVVPDVIDTNYVIYEEVTSYSDIYATYDSAVKIGTAIGTNKSSPYFNVLGYNVAGYDTSALLTFDVSSINMSEVSKIELYSYYYEGDIPDRQQPHPVRKMTTSWNDSTLLTYAMMDATYSNSMISLDTANYGYGWRKADVTNMVTYWQSNPSLNYGVVIDNTRGAVVAGGIWNNMKYYSMEANADYRPRLRITYNTNRMNKYIKIDPTFDSGVKINNAIGINKNQTSFTVLGYNVAGYDLSGLLTFNLPESSKYNYKSAELFAYYYVSDIPERQQTHPVRKMISPWDESTLLTYAMMDTTYCDLMISLNTANYGYGWRRANVTDITEYWEANPTLNYGLVIDNNRGASVGGGIWSNMQYYSTEANNANEPYIKIYIEEK